MRISLKKLFWTLGLGLFFYFPTFAALVNRYIPLAVTYVLPLGVLGFLLLANRGRIKRYLPGCYIPWALFCAFMLAGSVMLELEHLSDTLTRFVCVGMGLLLMGEVKWVPIARRLLTAITGLYVFFTYFFFLFPGLYPIMIRLYGQAPTGTEEGAAGYRAGLAVHYSTNGILLSVCLMLLVVSCFSARKGPKTRPIKQLLWVTLTLFALLLTSKRGVLLWSVLALSITYLIMAGNKRRALGRVVTALFCGLLFVGLASAMVPELRYVIERFSRMGTDVESLSRLAMWRLALSAFLEHPLFGTGFWSFRHLYNQRLWAGLDQHSHLDAHNVYLQVLCETGVMGASLYLLAVGAVLVKTLKLAKSLSRYPDRELYWAVSFSLCIQLFYLLYSLSGNCLYDLVFYFYGLAMAVTAAVSYHLRRL